MRKVIPLPSEKLVQQSPMISSLAKHFGLELTSLIKPDPTCIQDQQEKTFNTFLVTKAVGSAYIPDQENFVIPYKIESALGCGGMLPSGNLFVLIMFTKVPVSREIADLFKPLTLSIKLSIMQYDEQAIFSPVSSLKV